MYESTFTFKTRRKHHLLLLTCLAVMIHQVASMALPIQCPEPCECYLNNNGIQSARCAELYQNQSAFPNIHVLVLRADDYEEECNIPKNIAKILPQLNYVYMVNCSLTSIPKNVFENLDILEEVDLSNNNIKKLDPSMFIHNSKLLYLNLQNNPLHIIDKPFLISRSLTELDLQSCGISEIPHNMFKNMTRLKFLTLSDNRLRTVDENTLPNSLRTINLAQNRIKNVPTAELLRLKHIKEIDLSENPVNCTCELMGFQNWVSGKGVTFSNDITCSHPRKYAGQQLKDLPQYDLCDARVIDETKLCGKDQICTNQILPEEDAMKKHDVKEHFIRDELLPVNNKIINQYIEGMQSDSASEGEGSGDGTNMPPIIDSGENEKSTEASEVAKSTEAILEKVTEVTSEVTATKESTSEATQDISKPDTTNSNTPSSESTTEKDNKVTSYVNEIDSVLNVTEKNKDSETEKELATVPGDISESPETISQQSISTESQSTNGQPTTDPNIVSESSQSLGGSTQKSSTEPIPNPIPSETTAEQPTTIPVVVPESSSNLGDSTQTSSTEPTPDPVSHEITSVEITTVSGAAESSSQIGDSTQTPSTEPTPDPVSHEITSVEITTVSGAAESSSQIGDSLNSTNENNSSAAFAGSRTSANAHVSEASSINLGYIIPCLAILIVIIICLGVYLGQRSSHKKKWETSKEMNGNGGTEMQEVSLLPDKSKTPIVKYNKYSSEADSEQTERLMSDGPSSQKSTWSVEEPVENGNSNHKLPNGQSSEKNEPIECAIAKVTTLPDSIPRTPVIRNAT